jgi:hypothetical protein
MSGIRPLLKQVDNLVAASGMRKILWSAGLGIMTLTTLYAFQRPFREYPGLEYNDFPKPADFQEKTEWAFARLMYPQGRGSGFGFRRGGGDWREGYSMWTQDYPRADRHFAQAMHRLTRIHVRSVEQPVNLDDGDDVDNWPWLYAVQVGQWTLTDAQAKQLREYLLRGGFFMCDDSGANRSGPTSWRACGVFFRNDPSSISPTMIRFFIPYTT